MTLGKRPGQRTVEQSAWRRPTKDSAAGGHCQPEEGETAPGWLSLWAELLHSLKSQGSSMSSWPGPEERALLQYFLWPTMQIWTITIFVSQWEREVIKSHIIMPFQGLCLKCSQLYGCLSRCVSPVLSSWGLLGQPGREQSSLEPPRRWWVDSSLHGTRSQCSEVSSSE